MINKKDFSCMYRVYVSCTGNAVIGTRPINNSSVYELCDSAEEIKCRQSLRLIGPGARCVCVVHRFKLTFCSVVVVIVPVERIQNYIDHVDDEQRTICGLS